eukprot:TRINITY_DN10069_c0_g1_i4.p1 TRINITY_DN10069_c0_g1~~TRINITY_DN10069_c0_g1_i4.p1  ORF type:complete len:453 (+),score=119.88 TRINITY_DN10069_c0_g1_i4:130-1488(+)
MALLIRFVAATLLLGLTVADQVNVGRTTLSYTASRGDRLSERWQNSVFSPSSAVEEVSGRLLEARTSATACTQAGGNVADGTIVLALRGGCDIDTIVSVATQRGAAAVAIIGFINANDQVDVELASPPNIPVLFTDSSTGLRALQLLDSDATEVAIRVVPINKEDDEPSVSAYARTAIFAIMCTVMVLVLAVYCHGYFHRLVIEHDEFRMGHFGRREEEPLIAGLPRAEALKQALEALTEEPYSPLEGKELDSCAVCLEDLIAGDICRRLPCKHLFHKECIDPWLIGHATCPLCKYDIVRGHFNLPAEGDEANVDNADNGGAEHDTTGDSSSGRTMTTTANQRRSNRHSSTSNPSSSSREQSDVHGDVVVVDMDVLEDAIISSTGPRSRAPSLPGAGGNQGLDNQSNSGSSSSYETAQASSVMAAAMDTPSEPRTARDSAMSSRSTSVSTHV